MNLSLLNSLCYTAGWFWCVLFGIHGKSLVALSGAIFLVLLQLYYTKKHAIALYIQDTLLAAFSTLLGVVLETFFIQSAILQYGNGAQILPPLWIICLYPLFSLLLNHSLKIIKQNYFVAFLFGFLGAPLSYIAGSSLGGVTFPHPLIETWIMIGICWGLFLSLLTHISHILEKAAKETLQERDSKTHLELLYDGECPICKREICMLRKKVSSATTEFTDIASKDFIPSEHGNIDYNTAMSEIHAIDGKGAILVGIPAFAAVYARCKLLTLSTLLRLPFLQSVLRPFYSFFAKNRLWLTGREKSKNRPS